MGADALLVEVHPDPTHAISDAAQQIDLEGFAELMKELGPIAESVGREM
jgi:3-deoxy-7-phosphoheptulonate synthase